MYFRKYLKRGILISGIWLTPNRAGGLIAWRRKVQEGRGECAGELELFNDQMSECACYSLMEPCSV